MSDRRANPLVGTRSLIRLALRRDRVTVPVWIVILGLIPSSAAGAYDTLYPTMAERADLTGSIGANPSVAVLYGPGFDLSTAGGFTAWRFGGFLALLTGLMAVFTVTRHTRAEEDSGRAELVASTAVGRFASLTAAIAVAAGASVAIGLVETVALLATDQPVTGSVALGLSTAAAGIVFTAIAALACQLAEYSRTANGIGSAVLGAAFLIRAVGDSSTGGRWISWLSPLGWAQQTRPFAGERWWVFVLPVVTALAVGAVAYGVLRHRDLGIGVLPPRPGPARAAARLASPFALAWRLQRGALIGWCVGTVVSGAVFGSIANGVGDLLGDSEQSRDMFERLGGSGNLIDAFLGTIAGTFGMVVSLYGVQAVLRMRSEETTLRVEPLLATRVRRRQWAASHLLFAFGGAALILIAGGAAIGLTHGLRTADVGGGIAEMIGATAAQIPATWLIVAVGVALFGFVPRWSLVAWAVAAFALLIGMFGPVVDAPQAVLDLSPFGHIPKLPGGDVTAAPFAVLAALGAVVLGAGLVAFRRRDIG